LSRLVVISGPSGSGKSSLVERLTASPGCRRAVTATTRKAREGEVQGRDYHFLGAEEFARLEAEGGLLEHAWVHGERYGTPRSEVQGPDEEIVLLVIDVDGHRTLRRAGAVDLSVFIAAPSREELRRRLLARGAEDTASVERRLSREPRESAAAPEYDHLILNDDLDRAESALRQILRQAFPGAFRDRTEIHP
jgi:guanylate kinase